MDKIAVITKRQEELQDMVNRSVDKMINFFYHIIGWEPTVEISESSHIKKYVCRPPDSASIAPTSNATMRDVTLQSI